MHLCSSIKPCERLYAHLCSSAFISGGNHLSKCLISDNRENHACQVPTPRSQSLTSVDTVKWSIVKSCSGARWVPCVVFVFFLCVRRFLFLHLAHLGTCRYAVSCSEVKNRMTYCQFETGVFNGRLEAGASWLRMNGCI